MTTGKTIALTRWTFVLDRKANCRPAVREEMSVLRKLTICQRLMMLALGMSVRENRADLGESGRNLLIHQCLLCACSGLAFRVWTEEPGRLQSTGSLRVGHDWSDLAAAAAAAGRDNSPRSGGPVEPYSCAKAESTMWYWIIRAHGGDCGFCDLSTEPSSVIGTGGVAPEALPWRQVRPEKIPHFVTRWRSRLTQLRTKFFAVCFGGRRVRVKTHQSLGGLFVSIWKRSWFS